MVFRLRVRGIGAIARCMPRTPQAGKLLWHLPSEMAYRYPSARRPRAAGTSSLLCHLCRASRQTGTLLGNGCGHGDIRIGANSPHGHRFCRGGIGRRRRNRRLLRDRGPGESRSARFSASCETACHAPGADVHGLRQCRAQRRHPRRQTATSEVSRRADDPANRRRQHLSGST